MRPLDKEQRLTLRKLFNANLRNIGSMPLKHHGLIMSLFDRALCEMDRLAAQTPSLRGAAKRCAVCRIPSIRGVYLDGTKRWVCMECANQGAEP